MQISFNGKRVKIVDTFVNKLFNTDNLEIKRTFQPEPFSLFFGTEQIQLPTTNIDITATALGATSYAPAPDLTDIEAIAWIENYLKDCDLFFLANKPKKITLPAATTSYVLPAGTIIDDVVIDGGTAASFVVQIGTTLGGNDLVADQTIYNNILTPLPIKSGWQTNKTIYFTGVDATAIIKIYTK